MNIDPETLANLRADYRLETLDSTQVNPDPLKQFTRWFDDAMQAGVPEPNAMTLATATPDGFPSARIVLLKGFDELGFTFYTNFGSQKGQEMDSNPRAALVFCWLQLQRQVRISGAVIRTPQAVAERYFQSRPKGSQIGAWASPQSSVIPDRSGLEARVASLQEQYANQEQLPLPDFWGGYTVQPQVLEFWQGRSSRLHDRIRYRKAGESWQLERLAP
ncbi:MAG: pyridoxamine 5'-phosphate oxidase [Bacteroidota bacterium]